MVTTLLSNGKPPGSKALDDDVDLARDRVLVTRAQAGDRSAFDDLYVRYYRRLYRFCVSRLHDSHEAEDVAQEAFARAWRALGTFDGERRFYPWLSVIAAHLCTDVHRRRKRSTPVAEFYQSNLASGEETGEEIMLAAVDSELVARAFKRLSDRHQRVLRLREASEFSYQEIAEREGLPTTAVETLLWRARQALKREFAALARAEGRIAAWIGGGLSVAGLRRLLGLPMHRARKLAQFVHGGGAVAVGSAAAATAMVVAATMSGPMAQTPGQVVSRSGIASAGAVGGAPVVSTPEIGSSGPQSRSGSVSPATAAGSAQLQSPSLPAGGQGKSLTGSTYDAGVLRTSGDAGGAGAGTGAAVQLEPGGVANSGQGAVTGVLQSVGDVTGLLGGLPIALLNGPVGQNPLANAANSVSSTLGDVAGGVAKAGEAAGTAVQAAGQTALGVVSGLLGSPGAAGSSASSPASTGGAGSGAASLLGGLLGG